MQKPLVVHISRVVILALCAMLMAAGCESTDETSTSLSVSPSSVTFQTYPNTVTFTVSGQTPSTTNVASQVMSATLGPLSMPLTWAVSNPNLGTIVESSGNQAVYQRTQSAGINVVTVQDQYGQEGLATINQETETAGEVTGSLSLSASPNPIPNGNNRTVITVSGGTGPYTWSVLAPSDNSTSANGTIINNTSTSQETYQSGRAGKNLIKVVDGASREGTITITQE